MRNALTLIVGVFVVANLVQGDEGATTPAPSTSSPSTDEIAPEDVTDAAYIDPADFLPEAFGQIVEEPLVDVPLVDLLPTIVELAGMPCRVVEHHFDERAIPVDVPVTLRAGVPLYMALDCMCTEAVQPGGRHGIRLAWVIDQGVLSLTTDDDESEWMQVRAYDVGGLLADTNQDAQQLIDLLQKHMPVSMWMDVDGIGGEIDPLNNLLVIRQNFSTHRRVAALLDALSKDAGVIYVDLPPESADIVAALDQPIHGSLDDVALSDVLRVLSDQTKVDFRFNPAWKLKNDAPYETPVTYTLVDQPLRGTLDLMLENVNGDAFNYVIRHEAIWILREFDAVDIQETVLYRVDDLSSVENMQDLFDLVQAQTSGEWIDLDGVGGEVGPAFGNYLIVTQTPQVHAEIANLLSEMRVSLQPQAILDPNEVITRSYKLNAAMAADLQTVLPKMIAAETWANPADAEGTGMGQLFVVHSDEATTLLVIKQSRRVHGEIESLIDEITMAGRYPAGTICGGWTSD